MSDGLVILVRFQTVAGARDAFLEHVGRNAVASVRDEPGCRRFDVLSPEAGGDSVTLYEIYDDAAAFDAHLASPHYAEFRAATANLVTGSDVGRFSLAENAKPGA